MFPLLITVYRCTVPAVVAQGYYLDCAKIKSFFGIAVTGTSFSIAIVKKYLPFDDVI